MKAKTIFYCTECGNETPKWAGRCSACGAWNSIVEQPEERRPSGKAKNLLNRLPVKAESITHLREDEEIRFSTGMGELDRVLGGGAVKGSLVLVGGAPGIGKSTLMLQICKKLGEQFRVLYISGEESLQQIKIRAERIGTFGDSLTLLCETNLDTIKTVIDREKPQIVIIDSIQTMYNEEVSSAPGSRNRLF